VSIQKITRIGAANLLPGMVVIHHDEPLTIITLAPQKHPLFGILWLIEAKDEAGKVREVACKDGVEWEVVKQNPGRDTGAVSLGET
jgi:hypothetical protein